MNATEDLVNFLPLHIAAIYNLVMCVLLLLKHGARLNVADRLGRNALMMASEKGSMEAFRYLLRYQPDVQMQNIAGQTALHLAAAGDLSCSSYLIRKLLVAGADPNIQDHHGDTPLHIVARKGAPRGVLVCLLCYGADPSLLNERGDTPFNEFTRNINRANYCAIHAFKLCLPTVVNFSLQLTEEEDKYVVPITENITLQHLCVRKCQEDSTLHWNKKLAE